MNELFSGVWTALVTPFRDDGSIDWKSFDILMEKQVEANVSGVVVSGTTGESPTLSVQENLSLIRRAKASFGTKIQIMAGVGGSNTQQSVELAKLSVESGADALLVVTPPYNKPSQKGLVAHYTALAKAQDKPICLYHVPGRTAHLLNQSEIQELTQIDGIDLVKEASANLNLYSQIRRACKDQILLTGDDPTFLASLSVGGNGVVSVIANIFPKEFVALYDAFKAGDHMKALAIHNALLPIMNVMFCESNPGPLKAAMNHMGLSKNIFRLPLEPVTEASHKKIVATFEQTQSALKEL